MVTTCEYNRVWREGRDNRCGQTVGLKTWYDAAGLVHAACRLHWAVVEYRYPVADPPEPDWDITTYCPDCGHPRARHTMGGMCDGAGVGCHCVRFPDAELPESADPVTAAKAELARFDVTDPRDTESWTWA